MEAHEITYAAVFGITSALSVLLNATVILCNVAKAAKLQPNSFLAFCLCCSDGYNSFINALVSVLNVFAPLEQAEHRCHILGYFSYTGHSISLLLVLGLTICRYMFIVLELKVPRKFGWVYSSVAVVASAIFCTMPLLIPPQNENNYLPSKSRVACGYIWNDPDTKGRIISSMSLVVMVVPIIFIVYAYSRIYTLMKRSITEMKRVLSVGSKNSLDHHHESLAATAGALKKCVELDEEQRALLIQSVFICVSFATGWSTYVGMVLYESFTGNEIPPALDFSATRFKEI
ncbi:family A G protein-coupled receptor-like protein [Rhizoclosmatium globosum]|uniref:Family A G protein-coupled receptor-like protein n=1 Tax=Rhizoclosmatium globosum TaxID=329046 RepID=A0A1Y2CCR8_9FUNG|nr:family A G protein-coupled receptor-like protein [Rhizoclosmatium globosum]|eukprot:ORY44838.1 family A G protein-coupled receptor-like protein [Rhizoclosmatium globosum]